MLFGSRGNTVNTNLEVTPEAQSMILECAIMENANRDEICAFLENNNEVQGVLRDNILLEKTIVRLDKKAKLSRAQKMASFTIAKEKNDRDFKKLLTVWKMERFLEARILKKYQSQALTRAKQSMNNAGKSKSNLIKKVANTVTSQLHSVNNTGAGNLKRA